MSGTDPSSIPVRALELPTDLRDLDDFPREHPVSCGRRFQDRERSDPLRVYARRHLVEELSPFSATLDGGGALDENR